MPEYSIEIVSRPVVEIPLEITAPLQGPVYWSMIIGKPETFPPSIHGHLISDITGLQTALDTRGIPAGGTTGQVLAKVSGTDYHVAWSTPPSGSGFVAWVDITGKPSTFTPSSHAHVISEVTNLQATLDGKAASSHAHIIADVTGLQTALDGKAAASHTHLASQISDSTAAGRTLLTAVDAAAQRTTLSINNVDNTSDVNKPISTAGQTALNGKADTSHAHAIADVTGLQTALDGKQASGSYVAAVQSIVNALIFG